MEEQLPDAAYVRVSEGDQNPFMQFTDIENYLKAEGRQLYKHKCRHLADFDEDVARLLKVQKNDGERATLEKKLAEIRKYKEQGWFVDYGSSGRKAGRKDFKELFESAESDTPQFSRVVVWALDRFTREGPRKTYAYMDRLDKFNVRFKSIKDPMLDTTGPWREVILAIVAAMAKQESDRQSDRVRSGIQEAKRRGRKFGKVHTYPQEAEAEMLRLRSEGKGYLKIAKTVNERFGIAIKPASVRYFLNSRVSGSPEAQVPSAGKASVAPQ